MTWDETAGDIVAGAVGLGVGIIVAGKVIKDATSIKTNDDGEPETSSGWRL